MKIKARFVRSTGDHEDARPHKKGDVMEMDQASFDRWHRRGAVSKAESRKPKAEPKQTDKPKPNA